MKKYLIPLLIIFSSQSYLPAVCLEGAITFQKTFGGTSCDEGFSLQQTFDGGYIVAGITTSYGAGNYDVYLVRTDSLGDTMWTKAFGGTEEDLGWSVRECTDGGFIITGETYSFGINTPDQSNVYLIRTNSSGDTLWTKIFGGISKDEGYSVQPILGGTNGFIITGRTGSIGAGDHDVYLIRTDSSGDTLWTRAYGGTRWDKGCSIEQTQKNGFIIAGATASFGINYDDVYLIRIDSLGNPLWTKTYGGDNIESGLSVKQTIDGGYIITGYSSSIGINSYVYLIRTDSLGDTLWTKIFNGNGNCLGYSVQQTTDGGYIITGGIDATSTNYNAYLIKTDSLGNTLWTKTFGGTNYDYSYSVQQTTDGGFIITGYTQSFGAGGYDVYLIKTDSSGNIAVEESSPRYSLPAARFSVSPNPFTTSTTIQFSVSRRDFQVPIFLEIFDLSGKLVEKTDNPIIGKNLKTGIYFVKVNNSTPIKLIKLRSLK